jgi:hypothetical protein
MKDCNVQAKDKVYPPHKVLAVAAYWTTDHYYSLLQGDGGLYALEIEEFLLMRFFSL